LRVPIVEGRLAVPQVGAVEYAGRQQGKLEGVAGQRRQFNDPALVEHLPKRGSARIEYRRRLGYVNCFSQRTQLELDAYLRDLADANLNALTGGALEAVRFGRDGVESAQQVRYDETAPSVRSRRDLGSGGLIRGLNQDTGNSGFGRVGDATDQRTARILSAQRRRRNNQKGKRHGERNPSHWINVHDEPPNPESGYAV
jgi:hypothetical protein